MDNKSPVFHKTIYCLRMFLKKNSTVLLKMKTISQLFYKTL